MANWSSEFKRYKLTGFCPHCHKMSMTMDLYSNSGDRMPLVTPVWVFKPGWYVVCKKCSKRIDIFEGSRETSGPEIVAVTETHRSEELIGREERVIDNTMSQSQVTRTFTVRREWMRTLKLEREEGHGEKHELDLAPGWSFAIEETLKERYSLSESEREEYSEEVVISVPAEVKVRVVFDWKRIWQHGSVLVRLDGSESQAKFAVTAGLTFDQQQTSE